VTAAIKHSLGAYAIVGAAYALWALGVQAPGWWGAIVASTWFISRELAQFLRGTGDGPPLSEITRQHILQAALPTSAAFALAALIEWGNEALGKLLMLAVL
jgi:hypothetical protein